LGLSQTSAVVVDWEHWERLIADSGVEIDRPKGSDHPRYAGWIYPLDYGYIAGTIGGDHREVDVFRGSAENGLVAALVVRHDRHEEIKLLWNTTPAEIQAAHDFLADSMHIELVRRR
jgi:inorganic pyrophosphatase